MPAKDAWGCAFCCGTSSLIRHDALMRIGGVPTDSVTEDYLLTLRLKEIGFATVYLNEPLSYGLAPEGLKEYATQRGRWCLGFMQIVRGPSGPFSRGRRLAFIDRLSLIEAFLNWTFVYLYKVAGIIVPILFLLLDIRAVDVSLTDMLAVFLPYYVVQSLTMSWVSHGRVAPIMTDVAQLLTAPPALKAALVGLFGRREQKFSVTAKGGSRDRRFVEWPLLRFYATLLVLAVLSVLVAFTFSDRHVPVGHGTMALVWSWYNIAVLVIACIVCIEQPRLRRSGRFPMQATATVFAGGRRQSCNLRDLSVTGAQLAGEAPGPTGTALIVAMGNDRLLATVVRVTDDAFAVRFENSLKARVAIVRRIYSAVHQRAIRQVQSTRVVRAVVQRLFR
jgi:cellulose synthase (UDP-forming)